MGKYPKKLPIKLQERLHRYAGRSVGIHAEGLSLEPGKLTKVFKTFIIVQGERFVPRSTNYIQVFDVPRSAAFYRVGVRTTFDASGIFDDVQLVLIGKDFIELQTGDESNDRYLLPLNKVVGLFGL